MPATTWWSTICSINLPGINRNFEPWNFVRFVCRNTYFLNLLFLNNTQSLYTFMVSNVVFPHSYFLRPERNTSSISGRYIPLGGRPLPSSAGHVGIWKRTPKPSSFAFSLCLDLENHWATLEARFRFPAQTTGPLFRGVKLGSACYHSRRGGNREAFHVLHWREGLVPAFKHIFPKPENVF